MATPPVQFTPNQSPRRLSPTAFRDVAFGGMSPNITPGQYPPMLVSTVRRDELPNLSLQNLPRDILLELLANAPTKTIAALCSSNTEFAAICQDESFLARLIVRRYGVSLDNIPRQTIKEKYRFMSIFDPRYFTDPDFVKVSRNYKRKFGTNYTSRKNPNDALNTIVSIWRDSATVDIHTMNIYSHVLGQLSRNFVNLLSGAMMTKSQPFANSIIAIFLQRIRPEDLFQYMVSFRYPFIFSIEYGMVDTTNYLLQYYAISKDIQIDTTNWMINVLNLNNNGQFNTEDFVLRYYDPSKDTQINSELLNEARYVDSEEVFDRFLHHLEVNEKLYWDIILKENYAFAEYVLGILINAGRDPYANEKFVGTIVRVAIMKGQMEKLKYLMRYITPTQKDIDLAAQRHPELVPILQGQDIDVMEEDIEQ